MTHPRDYLPVLDRIGAALEATCDALMTLQSIDVLPGVPKDEAGDGNVVRAISHLRHAVDELRDAQAHGQTGLALGFVLARDQRNAPAEAETRDSPAEAEPDQSSPRRTA